MKKQLKDIEDYLQAQQKDESEFGLVLGIGSLLTNPNATDYQNQSNVLNVAHLGLAVPQLLTGVSFRSRVPSLFSRYRCDTSVPGRNRRSHPQSNANANTDIDIDTNTNTTTNNNTDTDTTPLHA